ncbi:ATP-binding cassette domain-containing protein [Georgenia sp. 10Sc9-8]|uniref:ATP-binding cassette domain-containing protein n=1 Tax=Georgenia halotolerans TaxID=3028317 RepID=A0ABT5TVX2_9MICO|nr:ATP-binding cassette domain-containing protein [Georgenia halotolerans]
MADPHDDDVLVSARELSVGYAGVQVCPPVSLALRAGQVLAVVGANGTGKSTLRTVVGALEPLGGQVTVLGERPDPRDQGFRAAVAAELGDDAVFPALTVAEHLLLTAYGHGLTDAQEVVDGLLAELTLERHRNVLPHALSSGQRRRLLLASVLARPREVLVLDEPEQRLDAGMRTRLGERLRAEGQAGPRCCWPATTPRW